MDRFMLTEAFNLAEDVEEFSLNASGLNELDSFLDMAGDTSMMDDDTMIIDLEAQAEDELKQSYVGKAIINCNICHSNIFINKDEITISEEEGVNVDLECPYCHSLGDGYTIIGEVKPFEEKTEEEAEDEAEIEEPAIEETGVEEVEDTEVDVEDENLEEALNEENNSDLDERARELISDAKAAFESEDEDDMAYCAESIFNFIDEYEDAVDEDLIYELSNWEEELENSISNLYEGLKADRVAKLRKHDKLNGKLGLGRKLEASDEIRGPHYTELNESCDEEECDESLLGDFLNHSFNTASDNSVSVSIGEACDEEVEEGLGGAAAGAILGGKVGHPVLGAVAGNAIGNEIHDVLHGEDELEENAIGALAGAAVGAATIKNPEVGALVGDAVSDVIGNALDEDIQAASITTDDEIMTMETKEDGGVEIETTPIEEAPEEEMVAPLDDEAIEEIEVAAEINAEENADAEEVADEEIPEEEIIDEIDEESFNGLGESYLKRCYDNVDSFKTTSATINEGILTIEGKIGFASGNEKNTTFVFEGLTSKNRQKIAGCNEQISRGKKSFKLGCSVENGKVVCESLNYNYKTKNENDESVRVYGTVRKAK